MKKLYEIEFQVCSLNGVSIPDKTVLLTNVVQVSHYPGLLGRVLKVYFNSQEDMLKAKELTNWTCHSTEPALLTSIYKSSVDIGQYRYSSFDCRDIEKEASL